MEDSGTSGSNRHDVHHAGATMLSDMGIEPHIIEAAFNHISIHSQLAASYDAVRHRTLVADAPRNLTYRLDVSPQGGIEVHTINISRDSHLHTK